MPKSTIGLWNWNSSNLNWIGFQDQKIYWQIVFHALWRFVPDAKRTDEPEGHEFGSYCFEELKPAEVLETVAVDEIKLETGGR